MSRSRRRNPITGSTTARSERGDKQTWHSRMRATERDRLVACDDFEGHLTTDESEVSDPWRMRKDGKIYFGQRWPRLMRK